MRITGGEYRGRKVGPPVSPDVKPTPDRVRVSIFNILRNRIPGARVLDLFTGTGLLGLEFLSLGAAHVTFSDKSPECIRAVERALTAFKTPCGKYRLLRGDFLYVLQLLRNEKFDIIYIDPPYRGGLYAPTLDAVFARGMLAEGGVTVAEHSVADRIAVPEGARLVDERAYGTVGLTFMSTV